MAAIDAPAHAAELIINEHYKVIETKYGQLLINRHEFVLPCSLEDGVGDFSEVDYLCQFAKGTVVDIGANMGTHTLAFAKTAEHVIAFEPQLIMYYRLCANLLLNNVMNVSVVQNALGSGDGIMNIPMLDPTQRNLSAGISVGQGEGVCTIHKLDTFDLAQVHFIKIDVEAWEFEVLKGAHDTLLKFHPIVFVEVHLEEFREPIKKYMAELGYTAHHIVTANVQKPETGEFLFNIWGYLFVPEGAQCVWVNEP